MGHVQMSWQTLVFRSCTLKCLSLKGIFHLCLRLDVVYMDERKGRSFTSEKTNQKLSYGHHMADYCHFNDIDSIWLLPFMFCGYFCAVLHLIVHFCRVDHREKGCSFLFCDVHEKFLWIVLCFDPLTRLEWNFVSGWMFVRFLSLCSIYKELYH